jgi:anti-sigma factor RsiW
MSHPTDDLLERYSMGTLEEEGTASVEEHLLACGFCTSRFQEAEKFIAALREALETRDRPGTGLRCKL